MAEGKPGALVGLPLQPAYYKTYPVSPCHPTKNNTLPL